MERALAQAREGRLHILDGMDNVLSAPRKELPQSVPKMSRFSIPAESIGKVIGPGGKQIRAVIEDFDLVNMDVAEDGSIQLTSMDADKLSEAQTFVEALVAGGGKGKRSPGSPDRSTRAQTLKLAPFTKARLQGRIPGEFSSKSCQARRTGPTRALRGCVTCRSCISNVFEIAKALSEV